MYATQNKSISNHRIVELAEAPRVAAKAIEAAEAPRRLETVEADDGAQKARPGPRFKYSTANRSGDLRRNRHDDPVAQTAQNRRPPLSPQSQRKTDSETG